MVATCPLKGGPHYALQVRSRRSPPTRIASSVTPLTNSLRSLPECERRVSDPGHCPNAGRGGTVVPAKQAIEIGQVAEADLERRCWSWPDRESADPRACGSAGEPLLHTRRGFDHTPLSASSLQYQPDVAPVQARTAWRGYSVPATVFRSFLGPLASPRWSSPAPGSSRRHRDRSPAIEPGA